MPVQRNVRQRALPNSENFIAQELHVGRKERKYMACLPLYHKEMRDLPQTHPEVYNEFINGNFTIQHKKGKRNDVWSDLALEQIKIAKKSFSQRSNTE